jgi:head-tail adaptor
MGRRRLWASARETNKSRKVAVGAFSGTTVILVLRYSRTFEASSRTCLRGRVLSLEPAIVEERPTLGSLSRGADCQHFPNANFYAYP